MEKAQKSAVGPEMLPNEILRSIGCCALRDLGGMAWVRVPLHFISRPAAISTNTLFLFFLPGHAHRHVLYPIQLFHRTVHGGSTVFERLQGAQQKQKGQKYVKDAQW